MSNTLIINQNDISMKNLHPNIKTIINDIFNMNLFVRDTHNRELLPFQVEYTHSECDELLVALKEHNVKEIVDAIGDIFVTGIYSIYLLCHSEKDFWVIVDKVLNSKLTDDNNFNLGLFVETRNFISALQGINFVDQNNKKVCVEYAETLLFGLMKIMNAVVCIDGTNTPITNWVSISKSKFNLTEKSDLFNLNIGDEISIFDFVMNQVSKSNWSKFPPFDGNQEEAEENIQHIKTYLKAKSGEDVDVGYKEKQGRVIYFNKATNKFLKPKSFIEPNLTQVLDLITLT